MSEKLIHVDEATFEKEEKEYSDQHFHLAKKILEALDSKSNLEVYGLLPSKDDSEIIVLATDKDREAGEPATKYKVTITETKDS